MDYTAENYTAGNYTAGFPSIWEGGVPKGRGGRCGHLLLIVRQYISYTYIFTYHLPLRVLLLPEGGEL